MSDIFRTMDALMRQMDQMDAIFSSPLDPHFGQFGFPGRSQQHNGANRSLRDQFIDYNTSRHNTNDDMQLAIGPQDYFTDIMTPSSVFRFAFDNTSGPTSSYAKSYSVSRVVNSNGKVVEKRVETDSQGNRVEKVTRSLGDKTHSLTTKSDATGVQEQIEDLYNIDDDNVETFEREWNRSNFSMGRLDGPAHRDSGQRVPAIEPATNQESPQKKTWKNMLKGLIGL